MPSPTPAGPPPEQEPDLAPSDPRELAARLLDPAFMLEVFRRELPAWSTAPIRVLDCSVKPGKTAGSRKAIREQRQELVYRVDLELQDGQRRPLLLYGLAPAAADFPAPALAALAQALRGHPLVAPIARPVALVPQLQLGLLLFPLDPALPALAELTTPDAARLLAPLLPECRAGARIEQVASEVRHYKPGSRAVLRVCATLRTDGEPLRRAVYVKLFADEQGAEIHAGLQALARAARGSPWLRVPEPLGYDPQRRMMVIREVPGGRDLAQWIHAVETGQPLPPGTDLLRLERGLLAVAHALRALQQSRVEPPAQRTFQDALAPLRKDCELLRAGLAGAPQDLCGRAFALLERLERSAPQEERLLPAHGACRPKQSLGDEHTLTFIDWDGLCLADPALDPATFLARLRLEPITTGRGLELERLAVGFRREVCALVPAAAANLDLYEALMLAEKMLRSLRGRDRDGTAAAAALRLADAAEERLRQRP